MNEHKLYVRRERALINAILTIGSRPVNEAGICDLTYSLSD
jgi:hypothetical protein